MEERLIRHIIYSNEFEEYYASMNEQLKKKYDYALQIVKSQYVVSSKIAKAKAWYYAELLKDERKRQNVTQKVLAEKIGKKREYISSLEKGQTDMQLSTFLRIADALGLRFSLVLG